MTTIPANPFNGHCAKARCSACGDTMESERPGHLVRCACGKSFVDTDRWDHRRHRFGYDPDIKPPENLRPKKCTCENCSKNPSTPCPHSHREYIAFVDSSLFASQTYICKDCEQEITITQ